MLKKCYGLFLGLVVLAGSACVTPTYASSASIVITNIRAGGQVSALEEGVVLYNNSSFEADITGWCLTNKTQVKFACVQPTEQTQAFLPAYSYATIVSTIVATSANPNAYAATYESSNHSSGAIVASSDTISLLDADDQLIDQYSWSSSLSSTQQWARMKLSTLPDIYLDNNSASDWQKLTYTDFPISQIIYRTPTTEEPTDPEEPQNPTNPDTSPSASLLPAVITELLPNAVGSDTGNEFIEIYNPNKQGDISLKGYRLAIGPALEKIIVLGEYTLKPGEYKTFTNAELGYTLLNTSSLVNLITDQGVVISEVPSYDSPAEGEAWAFIDTTWQYTNQPTPGAPNLVSFQEDEDPAQGTTASTPKPCAANQYRSLETNRCRLISSASSAAPAPCKVGQERNPETNRCRNINSSTTATTCKEGQEKNPDTNRCRTIKKLSTASFGVKGATTKQGGMGWYIWAAIGGVMILIIGYGVWEWREELMKLVNTVKAKFAGRTN
jgi:hypothetical protein